MSWLTSLSTVLTMELLIRKNRWAWPMGCFNQLIWLTYIIAERQWGLLPLNCVLWVQNIRGTWKWWKKP